MKNKSNILNVLFAIIIVVLVYQLTQQSDEELPSVKQEESSVNQPIASNLGEQTKISVGVKGHIMPKPALVIGTYGADGNPNIMTAAWAGICNSNPLSIAVSIRESRLSYENIMATKSFTVNVPSTALVAEMDYLGNISGHDVDKFKELGLTPMKGEYVNAPYIKEFPIAIECEVTQVINLGSHTQFIGKVIDTKVDEHLIKENGAIDIEALQPVFYEDEYYYSYGIPVAKPWDAYKLFVEGENPTFKPKQYTNATIATIHERKSVRHFTNQKVTNSQLEVLLKAGMAAPTAVNKQPWAFVAITDKAVLNELEQDLPYAKMLSQASAAIVVCGDLNKAIKVDDYWIQDCSAATQNILLAAESIGLGAVWTGVFPRQERIEVVKTVLGLPEHMVPLNVIPIGYPTGEDQPKDKWKPENVYWQNMK